MAQQENRDIEKLEAYSFPELQQIWRDEQLGEPPRIRRKLMASLLAYHLQNKTEGALLPALGRRLRDIAGDGSKTNLSRLVELRIKPGTRLHRVFRNELHEVTALENGFIYRGTRYESLSVIAREITKTRWSGPAFFGLKGDPPKAIVQTNAAAA